MSALEFRFFAISLHPRALSRQELDGQISIMVRKNFTINQDYPNHFIPQWNTRLRMVLVKISRNGLYFIFKMTGLASQF